VTDFLNPLFSSHGFYPSGTGWNIPYLNDLYSQAVKASQTGNDSGLILDSNLMNKWANQHVMYVWTQYQGLFYVMTSNVQGYYFNPSNYVGLYQEYWASLS